jgi:hypothetical protein
MRRFVVAVSLVGAVIAGCGTDQSAGETASQEGAIREMKIDCTSETAGAQSFESVRDAVYEAGESIVGKNRIYSRSELPRRGKPLRSILEALNGSFAHDLSQILQCSRDFRANPQNADKVIHASGICASATWEIDESAAGQNRNTGAKAQPYTGLFAPQTKVNAIVRISSGTNVSDPNARGLNPSWGIAVKLFPVPMDQTATATKSVQLVMFDQSGVAGTSTREMLRSDDPSKPHFFINWMYGSDLFALGSIAIFNQFVTPHQHLGTKLDREARLQALDEVARVKIGGAEVPIAQAHYPTIVKLALAEGVPTLDELVQRAPGVDLSKDFRDQLLTYEDGELAFDVIGDNDAKGPETMKTVGADHKIGRLRLNKMVVSDVCDKNLSFKHRRNGEVFTGWRPEE